MKAVWKKELRQYLTTLVGTVFLTAYTAVIGYFFVVGNLLPGKGSISGLFQSVFSVLMVLIPMLTMRSMSEEKKQRTDQLLFTAPLSDGQIVAGKFFSAYTIFILGSIPLLCAVSIFKLYGNGDYLEIIGNFIALFLAGAAFIAIGIFASSLSENQMASALISYAVVLILWSADFLKYFMGDTVFAEIISYLSFRSHFQILASGVFNLSTFVYFVSMCIWMLFWTCLILKRRKRKNIIRNASILSGFIFCLLGATAVVLTANYGCRVDLTEERLYTLSGETKKIVIGLKNPVHITVMNQKVECPLLLTNLLEEYGLLSTNLEIRYMDPYLEPDVIRGYESQGFEIELNDVLIEGNEKRIQLKFEELFQMNAEQTELLEIKAEQKLTSAVHQIAYGEKKQICFIDGHGETPSASLMELFKNNHYRTSYLELSVEEIPEDAELLVLCAPRRDFNLEETKQLERYILNGGSLMVFLEPGSGGLINLLYFLEDWGIGIKDEVVSDPALSIAGNALNIAAVYASHEINQFFTHNRYYVIVPSSAALYQVYQKKGEISTREVLRTSPKAYLGNIAESAVYDLVLTSEVRNGAEQHGGKIVVFGSQQIYGDDLLSSEKLANRDFLVQTTGWCMSEEELISIAPKLLSDTLLPVPIQSSRWLAFLMLGMIPGGIFVLGTGLFLRRRYL